MEKAKFSLTTYKDEATVALVKNTSVLATRNVLGAFGFDSIDL